MSSETTGRTRGSRETPGSQDPSPESGVRFLVLAGEFYPMTSGGALEQWNICRTAAEQGHEPVVFTTKHPECASTDAVDGVRIHRRFKSSGDVGPDSALGLLFRVGFAAVLTTYLVWWLRDEEIDVIYSPEHLFHPFAKFLGLVYRVPSVNFVAYTPSLQSDQGGLKRLLERLNFRYLLGEVVFIRVPEISETVRATNPDADVVVVPGILDQAAIRTAVEAVPEAYAHQRFGFDDDASVLAFVGRLVPIKNPSGLLDVIEELPDTYRLIIVGDGRSFDDVRAAIDGRDLAGRVVLAGELPHEEALATIATADGLVLTSHAEAYPTVAFEALATGTPVYSVPVGVLPNLDVARLHLATLQRLPEVVEATDHDQCLVHDEALRRFSMDRCVETMFDRMEKGVLTC